jgi:ribose/xylose/arabinose/galactoside ABC-type transport system permease subunit
LSTTTTDSAPPDASPPPPPSDSDAAAAAARAARYQRQRAIPREIWPLLALAALLVFNFFFTPGFFHMEVRDGRLYGILIDIADRAAPVMLLAIGMTLVIATGGVDLSVGAVMAIAGAITVHLIHESGQPLWLALLVALGASLVAGIWNGALVAFLRVQPIVATLILMVSGRGLAQLISDGQIITVNPADHPGFAMIGNGAMFGLPFTLTLVAIGLLTIAVLTRKTAAGLFIEAVGNNRVASQFAGINERLVTVTVYAITGLCAGVAGLIAASDINAADANNAGLNLELDAILAVVLGGTALTGGRFYLLGAMLGALIIQTMTTMILTRNVPVELNLVVKAIVVVAVCLLQAPRFRELALAPLRRRKVGRGAA